MSISPDGKYVAFVVGQAVYETNSYRSAIYVTGTESGSTPIALGTAGSPRWDIIGQWLPDRPQWSPDSKQITRVAKMDSNSLWQVWRWPIDGGAPVQVTNVPGDVQSYRWTTDGNKIVVTFEKPRDPRQAKRLHEDGILYDGSFAASHGGPVLREVLASKPLDNETWIHDLATGEERRQTRAESESIGPWISDIGEDYFDPATSPSFMGHHLLDSKISPDGNRVAYRMLDDSPGTKVLYRLFSKPVHGGTPVEEAPGVYFVADYRWSLDSSKIYFTENTGKGQPNKFMAVPATGGTPQEVFQNSDALYDCSYDNSFQRMACVSERREAPARIALVDLRTGSVRTLVDLNPEFTDRIFGLLTRLEGVNKYGDSWWASLVRPVNYEPGRKYPLIVTTYRNRIFPRGASGDENPVDVYAAHGFAVLTFDFGRRDYDNKPGDFERYLSWDESVSASIDMAIQKASETGMIVDTERIGLTGYSRGTEIVAYEITHTKRFRAVSGAAGDDSPYFYYMATKTVQDSFSREGTGGWPEGESAANWRRLAPELNAEKISAPVINNDPDSEFLQDLALYTSLRDLGKPVELYIYPNELHSINQPAHRYQIYERNLDWFRFWLKGEEDLAPSKLSQYIRWRGLRDLLDHTTSQSKSATPTAPN